MIFLPLFFVGVLVTSCSALGVGQENTAVETAEVIDPATEGTALRSTLNAQATHVLATAAAAETYIVQRESINGQLLLTLRAAVPPTQQVVQAPGQGTPSVNALPSAPGVPSAPTPLPGSGGGNTVTSGGTEYTALQTASGVSAADGCAIDTRSTFTTSDPEIYFTARAYNITAGTQLSSSWSVGGQVVYEFSFNVNVDDDDFCLWFSIDPATVTFTPGTWTVQLYADNAPIGAPVTFTITEG